MNKQFSKEEMIVLINKCYDAVDQSKLGPMFGDINGQRVINQITQSTFLNLLGSELPHRQIMENTVAGGMTLREPGENWKGDK